MNPLKLYNGCSMEELRDKLAVEKDPDNIQEITKLLNAHLAKKEIVRKSRLSELQDHVEEQMTKRVIERGDNFSNKDLLDYYKVIDETMNRIDTSSDPIVQQIKVTKQEVNINLDKPSMSREEKTQVVDAVKAFIQRMQNEQITNNSETIDGEFKEINND